MFRTNTEATAVEMFPGVVRRTLNSGDLATLIEVTLADGAVLPAHTPPHEQVGSAPKGRARFDIDGAAAARAACRAAPWSPATRT